MLAWPQSDHEERRVAFDEGQPGERPVALVEPDVEHRIEVEVLVLERVVVLVRVRDLLDRPDPALP